ncbi:MAG: homoserine O-acetyltransferase [Cyanobium sp. PLM2.Bin73]|jgi:homoserine O-acetyltransferase|nr:MAG: homoserine O-acetyltransferase [Cyanobium sp. PLM2.Bin73]
MNRIPSSTRLFRFAEEAPMRLRAGGAIGPVDVAFQTWGILSQAADNAVLVFHAMTGSQNAAGTNEPLPHVEDFWTEECREGWWSDFIGPGLAIDTEKYFVVCANYLGGCYGSTGPCSPDPVTGKPYGSRFPDIRVPDLVDAQMALVDHLGIDRLHAVVGASVGGMMAVSLATRYPKRVRIVVPIGSGMEISPLQRILNLEQALAIEMDPHFSGGDYYDSRHPEKGLALARMIAHKTFVSLSALLERARGEVLHQGNDLSWYRLNHTLESYMLHQGGKFVRRFDANSYLRILDAWQNLDLLGDAGASDYTDLFSRCQDQRMLIFTIDSDVSFYPEEQERLSMALKSAGVRHLRITVHSDKGHDSFLLEPELFHPHIAHALDTW